MKKEPGQIVPALFLVTSGVRSSQREWCWQADDRLGLPSVECMSRAKTGTRALQIDATRCFNVTCSLHHDSRWQSRPAWLCCEPATPGHARDHRTGQLARSATGERSSIPLMMPASHMLPPRNVSLRSGHLWQLRRRLIASRRPD